MRAKPTVLWLMGLVAAVAVGLAAVRSNDVRWAAAILTITVLTLCAATVAAFGRRRTWVGFAVFGWVQFFLCPPYATPGEDTFPSPQLTMAYRLVLSVDIEPTATRLTDPSRDPGLARTPDGSAYLIVTEGGDPAEHCYVPVYSLCACLCLWSLAAGVIGAVVGGILDRRPVPRDAREAPAGVAPPG